ncbi:MAG: class II aldolase/adducin family protein [Planctomycetaceae bacterium]
MTTIDPARISGRAKAPDSDETRRAMAAADTATARELKFKLAAAYRMLADHGLDTGVAGHISVRVPDAPDYFWVNPFGLLFEEVTAEQLVLVNKQGEIVTGWPLMNYAGFCIHSAIHHARPDVNCIVHSHPPAGTTLSALGVELKMLDQGTCSFYEDHVVYQDYEGIVIDPSLATGMVQSLGDRRAAILVNHGLLTCASSIEQAMTDFIDLERACEINLRALATGQDLREVPDESARQAKSVLTNPMRWAFSWQALIRQLDRRTTVPFAPSSWGGVAGIPGVEMIRQSLQNMPGT